METTTEQPTTPVCPMTWAELNKKGFKSLELKTQINEIGNEVDVIQLRFAGFVFKAAYEFEKGIESVDHAAELVWQKFCNFINGRIN